MFNPMPQARPLVGMKQVSRLPLRGSGSARKQVTGFEISRRAFAVVFKEPDAHALRLIRKRICRRLLTELPLTVTQVFSALRHCGRGATGISSIEATNSVRGW